MGQVDTNRSTIDQVAGSPFFLLAFAFNHGGNPFAFHLSLVECVHLDLAPLKVAQLGRDLPAYKTGRFG